MTAEERWKSISKQLVDVEEMIFFRAGKFRPASIAATQTHIICLLWYEHIIEMFAFCSRCHHWLFLYCHGHFAEKIFEPLGYRLIFLFLCSSIKLWASAFGGEIKSISAKYSGSQLLQKVPISQCCASQTVFFLLSNGNVVTTVIHCKAVFPLWRLQRHLVVAAECWCVILEETQVCF